VKTPGWQSLVKVRRLNTEEDTWDIVAPFEESGLVKEANVRFIEPVGELEQRHHGHRIIGQFTG
jgi:hypothetical protein